VTLTLDNIFERVERRALLADILELCKKGKGGWLRHGNSSRLSQGIGPHTLSNCSITPISDAHKTTLVASNQGLQGCLRADAALAAYLVLHCRATRKP